MSARERVPSVCATMMNWNILVNEIVLLFDKKDGVNQITSASPVVVHVVVHVVQAQLTSTLCNSLGR